MSKKDEILRELDDGELLELARSVSGSKVDRSISRSVLTRMIMESFSLGEIKEKVKLIRERPSVKESTIGELRLGGIGQLLLSVSAIIALVSYMSYFMSSFYIRALGFSIQILSGVGIVDSIIFLLFVVLFRISAKSVTSTYGGSRVGTIGVATGFIAFAVAFSYNILTLLGMTTSFYFPDSYYALPNALGIVLAMLYSIFLGLTLILIGVFLIAHRTHFLNFELWLLAGIIYVFAGISEVYATSVYGVSVTVIVASVLGALCFLARGSLRHPETVKFAGDDLKAGAAGQVLLAISAAIMVVEYIAVLLSPTTPDRYQSPAPWGLASSVLFLIFGVLLWPSMTGVASKLCGNSLGKSSALLAVISAFTGMLYYGLTILGVAITIPSMGSSSLNELGAVMLVLYNALVAITTTLLGAFFLLHYKSGARSELWMASGVIYMIAGWYVFNALLSQYAPIPLLVAGCIGAASFLPGGTAKQSR